MSTQKQSKVCVIENLTNKPEPFTIALEATSYTFSLGVGIPNASSSYKDLIQSYQIRVLPL